MKVNSCNVAISTSSFGRYDEAPLKRLQTSGCKISLNPHGRKLTAEEVLALAADADGLIAGTESLTAEVLERLPRLKVISRCGVGMDNIDKSATERLSIVIRNTPDGPTLAVAELAVGLIISMLREIRVMDAELRQGVWCKHMGRLLQGKRVGIVGFGRIGQKVAELLRAFGVEIGYHDVLDINWPHGGQPMALASLLEWSQILSLHCSQPAGERPLIGAAELNLLPPHSILVNLARGGVVNEDALVQSLSSGHLAGAAIDVFSVEPYKLGPLTTFENVILTPHIGSYAREGRVAMENKAVENLLNALQKVVSR